MFFTRSAQIIFTINVQAKSFALCNNLIGFVVNQASFRMELLGKKCFDAAGTGAPRS